MKESSIISENQFYGQLQSKHSPCNEEIGVGIGDDGAVLKEMSAKLCVVKDIAVEGTHFKLEWSTFAQVLRKTLISNLSDLVAMGAHPLYWLVGLAIPDHLKSYLSEYSDLTKKLSQEFGITLIGGDLSTSSNLMVSITALGNIHNHPFLRSNCSPHCDLYLMGRPGLSQYGLDILSSKVIKPSSVQDISQLHIDPEFDLKRLIKLFQIDAPMGAMDLSDGLVETCFAMSEASRTQFLLDESLFKYPKLLNCHLNEQQKLEYFLNSGEEYFPLVCIPQGLSLPSSLKDDPDFFKIGSVQEGKGVEILSQRGNIYKLVRNGYSHL